ncbi:hypothetical protein K523DRAFT_325787 [Schizophyllum commune Tattone D]|nr:hypothetical protein K523DRAFT_325787 [Schizophyllum commune Tattone D]
MSYSEHARSHKAPRTNPHDRQSCASDSRILLARHRIERSAAIAASDAPSLRVPGPITSRRKRALSLEPRRSADVPAVVGVVLLKSPLTARRATRLVRAIRLFSTPLATC